MKCKERLDKALKLLQEAAEIMVYRQDVWYDEQSDLQGRIIEFLEEADEA